MMVEIASLVAPFRTPGMEVWLTYSDFFPVRLLSWDKFKVIKHHKTIGDVI